MVNASHVRVERCFVGWSTSRPVLSTTVRGTIPDLRDPVATFGHRAETSVSSIMPETFDVAVFLASDERKVVTGDEALLERFIRRYLKGHNLVSVRREAHGHS
jgi:hypothetical protein